MLLSEYEKNSGIVPGAIPAKLRYDPAQAMRSRIAASWRRQSLGAGYVPLEQQGFSFANNDISQPINFEQYSVASSLQPYQIQPAQIDFSFDPSSIQMPSLPELDFSAPTGSYSPQWSASDYVPPLPDFITPSAPELLAPSFTYTPQAPANPVPVGSSTDWLTNALKIATVGAQTYVATQAMDQGRPYVSPGTYGPAGLAPQSMYAPGVTPGVAVGAGLTAAQIAAMTPQQRVQYASMYPQASYPGVTANGYAPAPTDFVGELFGGMDTSKMLLLGGAGLLVMMLMMRRPSNA